MTSEKQNSGVRSQESEESNGEPRNPSRESRKNGFQVLGKTRTPKPESRVPKDRVPGVRRQVSGKTRTPKPESRTPE